jgi:hypothetical protein
MDERFVLHNAQLIQIGRRFPLIFGCGSAALSLCAFALNLSGFTKSFRIISCRQNKDLDDCSTDEEIWVNFHSPPSILSVLICVHLWLL